MNNLHITNDSDWPDPFVFLTDGSRYELTQIHIPELRYPIFARNGTTDLANIIQVFREREYDNLPIKPSTIVDLGAYCGYAAVYLTNKYSDAVIISVEPDPDSFRILLLNSRPYSNIHCLNAGVWSKQCSLKIARQVKNDWANTVGPADSLDPVDQTCPALEIMQIVQSFGLSSIDFLKIDIEGSEQEIFDHPSAKEWLGFVKMVSCETHDRLVPGCSEAYHRLFGADFESSNKGEFEYFFRKGLLDNRAMPRSTRDVAGISLFPPYVAST